jgi:hypothetical protein
VKKFLPFGRARCIWEDNIKVDLKAELYHVDYIHLAQENDKWQAVTNTITNTRFVQKKTELFYKNFIAHFTTF